MADKEQDKKTEVKPKIEDKSVNENAQKINKAEAPHTSKLDALTTEQKIKSDDKKLETKKEKKEQKPKKTEAIAHGLDLHASMKQCKYICRFIKGKTIDNAISDLQDVIKLRKVVPFKGEIPHRKDLGIMSGRYPVNASKLMINVLKGLKGNAIVSGLDIDKARIYFASSNYASRPSKRGGARFKRANILIKVKEIQEAPIKEVAIKTS